MNNWNGLDFIIFLIFASNTILGMARGATKEIVSILSLSVALIFTIKFTVPLATFFNGSPLIVDVIDNVFTQRFMTAIGAGPLTANTLMEVFYCISMLICFVGIFSFCEGALAVTGVVEMYPFPYAAINRKLGGTLGFTRGYVISLIFLAIVQLHLCRGACYGVFQGSYFANLFQGATVQLDSIISGQQPEQYKAIFENKDLYREGDLLDTISGGAQNSDIEQPASTNAGSTTAPASKPSNPNLVLPTPP